MRARHAFYGGVGERTSEKDATSDSHGARGRRTEIRGTFATLLRNPNLGNAVAGGLTFFVGGLSSTLPSST